MKEPGIKPVIKELSIRSVGYEDKILKVDEDIYEQLKDKSILVSLNNGAFTIRTYEGPETPSRNIMDLIVTYDKYKERPVFIDGDKFNRTRSNIKIVNKYEVRRESSPGASYGNKYKGVTYNVTSNGYISQIYYRRKSIRLGVYKDIEMAARVYDSAARYIFGENCGYINFPKDNEPLPDKAKKTIDKFLVPAMPDE